ncbi:hypothetical protein K8I28_01805 [bacterium]|nr:hypothetical protein [bacterium]
MEAGLVTASIGSRKIRQGLTGRMGEEATLMRVRNQCDDTKKRILIHCSSAGELESAMPLIEELHNQCHEDILLSIFSPSAIERSEKVDHISGKFYLPFDSVSRVKRMLEILEPSLIVMVKHDVWPNLVWQAKQKGIPSVLVNGNFRPDSTRLVPVIRHFNHDVMKALTAIYAVAEDDAERFRHLTPSGPVISAAGDTRFDRVRERALSSHADQGELGSLLKGRKIVVAGSTWQEDEKRLLAAWENIASENDEATLLLVPHEPTADHLVQIEQLCRNHNLSWTTLTQAEQDKSLKQVVIVDKMGILAGLYGLGCVAYVGGGFGKGVHSVIEPAVFGIPVLFGPHHLNSHEARDLVELGAGIQIDKVDDILNELSPALRSDESSEKKGRLAADFVEKRSGVAKTLASELISFLDM